MCVCACARGRGERLCRSANSDRIETKNNNPDDRRAEKNSNTIHNNSNLNNLIVPHAKNNHSLDIVAGQSRGGARVEEGAEPGRLCSQEHSLLTVQSETTKTPVRRPPLSVAKISRLDIRKERSEGGKEERSRLDFIHDSAANTHACNVRWAFAPGTLERCYVVVSGIEGGKSSEQLVAREKGAIDYSLPDGDILRVHGVLYTPEAELAVESGAPSVLFSTWLLAEEHLISSNFLEGGRFLELARNGKIYPKIESSCPGLYVDQQFVKVRSSSSRRVLKNCVQQSQCVKSEEKGSNYYYPHDTSSESETESETEDGENDVSAGGVFGNKNKPLNKQKSSSKLVAKQRRKSAKANGRKKRQLESSRLGRKRVQQAKRSVEKRKELEKLLHARIHPGKTQPILRALNKAYNEIFNLHDVPCDACCFAKGKYRPVKLAARRRATRVGERLHYDIFTAGVRSSRFGVKYLLVVIDEFSDFAWSFPLRKKSEAGKVLRSLVSHIEKRLAKRVENVEWEGFLPPDEEVTQGVAYLRSDNAGETMKNKPFQAWAREGGKWLETSNPGQQWQNGKAERIGGLIWKGGESLRYAANLPPEYWPFACRAFTHQRNRLPTARCPDRTPFEVFEDFVIPQIEQIEHFRVFGSLCYVVVHPDERVGKTEATERAMMLGYSDELGSENNDVMGSKKGYVVRRLSDGRIMSIAYKQLYESHEHVFLFPKPHTYDLFLRQEIKNNANGLSGTVAQAAVGSVSHGKENESKNVSYEPNKIDRGEQFESPLGRRECESIVSSSAEESDSEEEEGRHSGSEEKRGESEVSWGELNERASVGMPPLEVPTPYPTRAQARENLSKSALGAEDEWLRNELGGLLHGKLFPSEGKYSEKSVIEDSGSSSEGQRGGETAAVAGESQREVSSSGSESVEEEGKDEVRGVHSYKRTGKRQHGREYLVEWRGKRKDNPSLSTPLRTYTWEPAHSISGTSYYRDFREKMKNNSAHETTHEMESRHEQWP